MVQSVQGIAALSNFNDLPAISKFHPMTYFPTGEQRQVELLEASLAVLNSSWHLVEASKALTGLYLLLV
jgi:hypothetical protein